MKYKILSMLLCLCFFAAGHGWAAPAFEPKDCPKDLKYILGMYYGNGEMFLLRENNGEVELVYRFGQKDYTFAGSNVYPLYKEHFDSYTINESGPLNHLDAAVRIERSREGYGVSCSVGGNRYSRRFFAGENGRPFRFAPVSDWQALKTAADAAVMPAQLGTGQQAQLVDLAQAVPGLKFDLRYAQADNCFGQALTDDQRAFLDADAAQALAQAQQYLKPYGYGILVWEAYRPWSVSKLAYDALPADKKSMLPAPEVGFSHNTGRSIDVSLYLLVTGENAGMISGFDEPSVRQYASFAGGTTLERYRRDLLRSAMQMAGFTASETEWWHFDYGDIKGFAHLNVKPQ
ncbi:M15 family metallopeptidase [Phascolarctobacterium faecium]|nr:M15 family metallopeptidase [Phascolarctobacterium faecium]MDM8109949.1 M15 family metallopeptidase [Phascolarctobacterium faecium]